MIRPVKRSLNKKGIKIMRFAIASDEGTTISSHTGHCRCFVIFDIADNLPQLIEIRPNSHTAHAQGLCGTGENHSQEHQHHSHSGLLSALADCQVLISRGMGKRLIDDLLSHNITSILCDDQIVTEAAHLFASNKLVHSQRHVCSKC